MKEIFIKINGVDFSTYCNELKVNKVHNYNSQTNAAGDTVVDYINSKREIEVGIIPITDVAMTQLQKVLDSFEVTVSFLDPVTNQLVNDVKCIIPENEVEYYTIQAGKTMFNAFSFKLIEL